MMSTDCPGRATDDWTDAVPPHPDDDHLDLLEGLVKQDDGDELLDAFVHDARRVPDACLARNVQ